MTFKRRNFLELMALGGLGSWLAHDWLSKHTDRSANALSPSGGVNPTAQDRATPNANLLLRFVAIADTGTGTRSQYQVGQAMERYRQAHPFDLAILAGDNIYNNGEIEKIGAVFEQPYQALLANGVKFYACLGNHDIRTNNGEDQLRYPGFNMAGRYYTFRRDRVQFFALDTNGNADWPRQMQWLDSELQKSDAPWKIVFGHHQIYSSGHYGLNQAFIDRFSPLFKKYNVQLWINGHDHHYERSQVIDGTTYLICGAGAGNRPVGRSLWTAYSATTLSFAALEVYGDRLIISGIDRDNRVFDRGIVPVQTA